MSTPFLLLRSPHKVHSNQEPSSSEGKWVAAAGLSPIMLFVYTLIITCDRDRPLPMRFSEVKKMFDMCDEAHLDTKTNLQADFYEGDILDVVAGPFSGYKCEVIAIQGDKIKAQLDMFGRCIPAELTKEQVFKNDKS